MALDSNNMLNMQVNVILFTNYNVHFEIKSAIKIQGINYYDPCIEECTLIKCD